MSKYTVRVRREAISAGAGSTFAARVFKGSRKIAATDAQHLRKLDEYVRDVIVLAEDLDDAAAADLDLVWRFEDDEVLDEAARTAAELVELRARQARLVAAQHATIRRLAGSGMSVRDVAAVTGVSAGRVGQVVNA